MTLRGAVGRGDVELFGGRRHGRHRGAEQRAELDRGQTDTAAGAEDDELVSGLQPGDRPEHVVGGAVGHAERGGVTARRSRPGCG